MMLPYVVSLIYQKQTDMKNLEAKRDELFKVYDNWTKAARETSSIARMNVAQAKAKAAYAEICKINDQLFELA